MDLQIQILLPLSFHRNAKIILQLANYLFVEKIFQPSALGLFLDEKWSLKCLSRRQKHFLEKSARRLCFILHKSRIFKSLPG